jgi:hypothetical protein
MFHPLTGHFCPGVYINKTASRFGFQAFFPDVLAMPFDSVFTFSYT